MMITLQLLTDSITRHMSKKCRGIRNTEYRSILESYQDVQKSLNRKIPTTPNKKQNKPSKGSAQSPIRAIYTLFLH